MASMRDVTYKSAGELREVSIRDLLKYLDFLKPLLFLDNALVKYALGQYDLLQAMLRPPDPPLCLENFELSIANARIFFPSTEPSIERVLQLLSFQKPIVGQVVYFLDVLTVLVIIFRGSLLEKARYLFDWYNVSKTGVLTEVEHAILIRRTSECFYKIKAIGIIDVTEEDAQHIALEARVRKNQSGQIKFIPGLVYEDFCRWTRDSAESAVLVRFVRVLDRLVDTLIAIRNRVGAIGAIVEGKKNHKALCLHVPKLDMFPSCREHQSMLYIIYRSQTTVTVCMSAVGIDCNQSSEAFVMCEKLSPVSDPFYEIPEAIQKKTSIFNNDASGQRGDKMPMCCTREYVLRSYQRYPLDKHIIMRGGPLLRVNISRLDHDSEYVFTVYTPTWKFPPIKASTMGPLGTDNSALSFAILPGSLSLSDSEVFVSSNPSLDRATALVFTSTICPIDSILRSCLLYAESDILGNNNEKFASAMAASCNALYSHSWSACVSRLIGMCSAAAAAARVGGLTPAHSSKQVFYHNGMGPWSNPHPRDQLLAVLGSRIFEPVYTELERIYAGYASTISPPRYHWGQNTANLVFMKDPNVDSDISDLKTVTSMTLTRILWEAIENAKTGSREDLNQESPFAKLQVVDLTLILRSPLDLMLPLRSWADNEEFAVDNTDPSPQTVVTAAPKPVPIKALQAEVLEKSQKTEPAARLTGRHELIHGEYHKTKASSTMTLTSEEVAEIIAPNFDFGILQKDTTAAAPKRRKPRRYEMERDTSSKQYDQNFDEFILALFNWAAVCKKNADSQNHIAARLVSSGWNNGVNFEIVHKASGARIEHICLLPTRLNTDEIGREYADETVDMTDVFIARMRVSLPEGCAMSIVSASPLRTILVKSSLLATEIDFISINKIYDKTMQPVGSEVVTLPKVRVLDGPRISRIAFDDVHLVLTAVGYGRIQCRLYELPFELDQQDAVSLVCAEKDKLRLIATLWQRCTKRRHMLFHFKGLLPYCNYCVCIEPEDCSFPLVAQFRTLYNPASAMSSIILACVSEADYAMPALSVGKISHLLSGLRPPAAPVHLMHHFSRRKRYNLGINKPHKVDLQHIYRRANVIHTLSRPAVMENTKKGHICDICDDHPMLDIMSTHNDYDAKFSPIQISYSGKFCRIAPRDGSERCLQIMMDAVDKLGILRPEIENLFLFVQRPLIRFLQKQASGLWTQETLGTGHTNFCARFVERALRWKTAVPGRDCQIVCFAEVTSLQVVTIGYRQISSQYNDIVSLGILDKGSFTEVPLDLVSSSVIYSDKEDDSIKSCSVAEEFQEFTEGGHDETEIGLEWDDQKVQDAVLSSRLQEEVQEDEGDIKVEGLQSQVTADPANMLDSNGSLGGDASVNEYAIVTQLSEGLLQNASPNNLDDSVDHLQSPASNFPSSKPSSSQLLPLMSQQSGSSANLVAISKENILHADTWEREKERILHDDDWQKRIAPLEPDPSLILKDDLQQSSIIESETGFQFESKTEAPPVDADYFGPSVNVRHIILPVWEHAKFQNNHSMVIFPDGLNMLGDKLEYFLNRDTTDFANVNIKMLSQNRALYGRVINDNDAPETAVYLLDLFIRPGEGNMHGNENEPFINKPEESVIGSQIDPHAKNNNQEPVEIITRNRRPYQYHNMLSRSFMHNVDFFEILMGPIIGNVSCDSARILFEVNMDLVELKFVARPLRRMGAPPTEKVIGDDEEVSADVVLNLTGVKAYKMVSCLFEKLLSGRIYQILLPEFCGEKSLGSFRTPKSFSLYAEVIIAGQDGFRNIPMVHSLLAQCYNQQMIDCKLLFREQRTLFSAKVSSLLSGFPTPSVPADNSWALIAEHLQNPLTESHMVIHLGSQSFLTYFLKDLINILLEHGRRLFLPLRDASAVEAYYFNQFEEVVRDMFRLVWSIPVLKEALASGSHMPLFIPEYLVSTRAIPAETLSNEGDNKLVAVIRKVFETHFASYICSLYDWNPDVGHHGRVWRSGPLAIVMLDLVSGRKKIKKKMEKENEGDSKAEEKGKDKDKKKGEVYSVGFLDKAQWTLIKNVAEDEFITQIVICSQLPFLALSEIPFDSIAPKEVPKGEAIEWSPTVHDLEQFFMHWIGWLQPKSKRAIVSKNIALVSSNFVPYVTTVQDLMTGSKIQQVCVGIFNADQPQNQDKVEQSNMSADFQLVGKIGRLKYIHKFGEQDDVVIDSSRESSGGGKIDPNVDLSSLKRTNYGVLKFCFDSWKAIGIWSVINQSELLKKSVTENPKLLIGPIVGPPEVYELSPEDRRQCFRVGVMIEVDCYTSVTFAVQNAFTNEIRHYTFDCVPFRPIMCSIGPLEIACRYNLKIIRGIRVSHCIPFVISTHMDMGESNFAFINAQIPASTIPNEDFTKELLQRFKVPFNGITVAVHLNSHPDFSSEIEELRRLPFLQASLAQCKKLGHMTVNVFSYFTQMMENIRGMYRRHFARPAYRELLRSSFTLFMQTYPIFKNIKHMDAEGDFIDESEAAESESESILRFIKLMFTRIEQEYFEQLNRPNANVCRAMFKREVVVINPDDLGVAEDLSEEEMNKILELEKLKELMVEELSIQDDISTNEANKLEYSDHEADPVKVRFVQVGFVAFQTTTDEPKNNIAVGCI